MKIVRQAIGLGTTGTAVGIALAAAAFPALSQTIQEASVTPTLAATAVALVISIVLLAAWLPASRAARIEPTLALRHLVI